MRKHTLLIALMMLALVPSQGLAQSDDQADETKPAQELQLQEVVPLCSSEAEAGTNYDVYLPLIVNRAFRGELYARASLEGCVQVKASKIEALLSPQLTLDQSSALKSQGDALISLEGLRELGLPVTYDQQDLTLSLNLIPDGIQTISLRPNSITDLDFESIVTPAQFAAGLGLYLRPRYVSASSAGQDSGFAPFEAELRGFVSMGGFENWSLSYQFDYRGDRESRLQRGEFVVTRDDFDKAIRYQIGDIRSSISGFQSSINLLGLGIERNYRAIQPFRNLRPGGRGTFTLERQSRVNYEVNGVINGSLDLGPGQYDIRDFPFATGANDVSLTITDEFGSREVGNFSYFVDNALLAQGTTLFGFNAGVLRQRAGVANFGPQYGKDILALGFIETGLRGNLTLGARFEASQDGGTIGGRIVQGLGSSVLAADFSSSKFGNSSPGYNASLRYSYQPFVGLDENYNQFDAQLSFKSSGFQTLGQFAPAASDTWSADVRHSYGTNRFILNSTASWQRDLGNNRFSIGSRIRIPLDGFNFSFGYQGDYSESRGEIDHSVSLSVTRSLGNRFSARASAGTGPNRADFQIRRTSINDLNDWSASAAYAIDETEQRLRADANFAFPRAEIGLAQEIAIDRANQSPTRSVTSANIGLGIGVADGNLAFGRPVPNGFYILEPHAALNGATVRSFRSSQSLSGRTDGLGSALVPVRRPYNRQTIDIEIDDPGPNIYAGSGQFELLPGLNSGYHFPVGSDPTVLVIGNLIDTNGQPLAFKLGELRPVGGEGKSFDFFTNRAGRFVAEFVEPRRYEVILLPDEVPFYELEVKLNDQGVLRVGQIEYRGAEQ